MHGGKRRRLSGYGRPDWPGPGSLPEASLGTQARVTVGVVDTRLRPLARSPHAQLARRPF